MRFWDRLKKYRVHGPQAASGWALQPLKVFRHILGEVGDEELSPLGWSRSSGLEWTRPAAGWVDEVIQIQALKSGAGVRWGIRLSFISLPKQQRGRAGELDLSYDPFDYHRDMAPWTVSQFATEEELRSDSREMLRRAAAEVKTLDSCCRDLRSLAACFEQKMDSKYVRLGFYHYSREVLAYAIVLGLVGRVTEALKELETALPKLSASVAEQEGIRELVTGLWKEGVDVPLGER